MSDTTKALRRALLAFAGVTIGGASSLVAGNYLMSGWSTNKVKTSSSSYRKRLAQQTGSSSSFTVSGKARSVSRSCSPALTGAATSC